MTENTSTVNDYFNAQKARLYNEIIRQSIPGYEALHDMVYGFLFEDLPDDAHILVAGAGTGMELQLLGKRCPSWRFTTFDISPEIQMIGKFCSR